MNDTRDQLRSISRALQDLHRSLLGYQRREYEKHFGRIGSDFYVLQLAAEDPQFAWLRSLSSEMIRIDELLAGKSGIEPVDLQLAGTRLRYLLTPTAEGNSFQSHYDRAMQVNPDIIMAHAAAMRSLPSARDVVLFRSEPPEENGGDGAGTTVRPRVHHPGNLVPGHGDHGYRALAAVTEVVLPPGEALPPATDANEDSIVWIAGGEARFDGPDDQSLGVDAAHPLVLNAGTGLEYRLSTPDTASLLHMLQAWVRPSSLGGEPVVQHGAIPSAEPGDWRTIAGPEDEDDPFHVRNNVTMSDIALEAGAQAALPSRDGWDAFFLVVDGQVEVDSVTFGAGVSGLVLRPDNVTVSASGLSRLVAFTIDPTAKITRAGRTAR